LKPYVQIRENKEKNFVSLAFSQSLKIEGLSLYRGTHRGYLYVCLSVLSICDNIKSFFQTLWSPGSSLLCFHAIHLREIQTESLSSAS